MHARTTEKRTEKHTKRPNGKGEGMQLANSGLTHEASEYGGAWEGQARRQNARNKGVESGADHEAKVKQHGVYEHTPAGNPEQLQEGP